MCQLFGLTSSSPVSPDFSLRGFFQRGGNTGEHSDGWGLALFSQGEANIQTHQSAAHNCLRARYLLERKPKSTTAVAHIRKATEGPVSSVNTHPFVRELWGDTWVFAHNGDLKNFSPKQTTRYQPYGETDSERAFCLLLNCLSERFAGRPNLPLLIQYVKDLCRHIAQYGTFNFLLSNGSILIAHCSTELYWAQRNPPYGRLSLLDTELSIDLVEINKGGETMVVLATKPLTSGEAWHPMGAGEIRVFENGELAQTIAPDSSIQKTVDDWNHAWRGQHVAII